MKYWKGKLSTAKEGIVGSMEDNGYVPDSEQATITEYNNYLIVNTKPPVITLLQQQIEILDFSSLADAKVKVKDILERLRKGER